MNKDILIAGSASLVLHGSVALFSLLPGHAPAVVAPQIQDKPIVFQLPPPPADPVEEDDPLADPGEKPSTPAPAPPSIADVITTAPSPIMQSLQPTLPPAPVDRVTIPPIVGPGGEGTGGPPIFDPGQLSRVPVAQVQVPPNYPFELKREGVTGRVTVSFIVDARGNVRQAYAEDSEYPEFASSAVAAVSKWRFQPGTKDGHAVATRMRIPICFNLSSTE